MATMPDRRIGLASAKVVPSRHSGAALSCNQPLHWEITMNTFEATLAVVGLFLLRLLLPLAVTFVFGYSMNRIIERWHLWAD